MAARARRASKADDGLRTDDRLPALDGVRGVAVLGVITTHTLGVVPGGFLGVDVFFALSGYLITSLLVSEWHRRSTIALAGFWSRRARRLLPALFLMLTAVGTGAAVWPQVFDSRALRGDTLATVLQVANWHLIATHANYFATAGPQSPLLHTWSLAIEEQFYVVWPIVVLVVLTARRRRARVPATSSSVFVPAHPVAAGGHVGMDETSRRRRLQVLFVTAVSGAVASALWMAVLTRSGADTTRAYYGSDTRAQAILIGAALALGIRLWGPVRSGRGAAALRIAGVAGGAGTALLWLFVPQTSALAYHGGFFLAALCTAGVIAGVAQGHGGVVARSLERPVLRYLGRISYGMYLWYWPFVLVLAPTRVHVSGLALLGERLACIIAVASASAYLVEMPIRRGHLPNWWAPLAMPSAAVLTVLTTFLATMEVAPVAAAARPPAKVASGPITATSYDKPIKVLIVGDSVAGTLGVGLGQVMSSYGVVAVNEGSPGCSVSMDQLVNVLWFTDQPPGAPCQEDDPNALLDQWRSWIDQFNPDVVIYLARSEVLNQEVNSQWTHLGEAGFDQWVTGRFHQATSVLGSRGAHVVLLTSPLYDTGLQPSGAGWPEDDPGRVLVDNEIIESMAGLPSSGSPGAASSSTASSSSSTTSARRAGSPHKARPRATNQSLIGDNGVTVIDTGAWLSPGGKYTPTVDGVAARCLDGVHFTTAGGEWLAHRILPVVTLLGRSHQEKSPGGSWSGSTASTPPPWYSMLPCAQR